VWERLRKKTKPFVSRWTIQLQHEKSWKGPELQLQLQLHEPFFLH